MAGRRKSDSDGTLAVSRSWVWTHEVQADGTVKPVVGLSPAHASELCAECGQHPLPLGSTQFSCEHGTWNLGDPGPRPAAPPAEPGAGQTE